MKPLAVPAGYNYIGVFLTLSCNLRCSYCINTFQENLKARKLISGKSWVAGLNRLCSRLDLPVTLQGGEPSLHPDFIYIINNLKPDLPIDILTNLQFDIDEFIASVDPRRLIRNAPYASLRVSFHPQTMDLEETVRKTLKLRNAGFSIGIWSLRHPAHQRLIATARTLCRKLKIDFRTKEFLGDHNGKLYGTYAYKGACAGRYKKTVRCKTSELLIDSAGGIFRCHADLYGGKNPIGSILDDDFRIKEGFRICHDYGFCNPCDVKVKTNRFQEFGHTSVTIMRLPRQTL